MNTCRILAMLFDGLRCLELEGVQIVRDERQPGQGIVTAKSDDDARVIAQGFGVQLAPRESAGFTWLSAIVDLDGIAVIITGPMHARPRLEAIP